MSFTKTVLITGASSGIGKETAYIFAENKYNLILVARRKDALEQIKSDIQNKFLVNVEVIDIDLARQNSAVELYDKVKEKKLKVDVLINNAGFGTKGNFSTIEPEKSESMLLLNVVTLTNLTKLFLTDMLKSNSGHIINIASTAAYQPIKTMAVYAATKAYILSFSEAVAVELKGSNVYMTAINPGPITTEFALAAGFPESKAFVNVPSSKDLAKFIYKSMLKKKVSAIHTFKNQFLMIASKFMTRTFAAKLAGKMMD